MFIISLVWGVVQLAALAGGGLYLYGDYKRNWAGTKKLLGGAQNLALRLTGRQEDPVAKARARLDSFAKGLDEFRRAVAAIEADAQVAEKQGREQEGQASQYGGLVELALRRGDEKTAVVAAEAQVQYAKRSEMLVEHAQEQHRVGAILAGELSEQENVFDRMRAQVATIEVNCRLAGAKERLYRLSSEIHEKTGLTPKAELEEMRQAAERRNIAAGILLGMARKYDGQPALRLLQSAEVEMVLTAARNRLALPEASSVRDTDVHDS